MSTPAAPAQAYTSVCPRCGAGLRCGMLAGDAECWCAQLPALLPVPSVLLPPPSSGLATTSCYCPACLQHITDERQNSLSPAPD